MEILPSIDLRAGKCVRLIQGDYARQINYADDPANLRPRTWSVDLPVAAVIYTDISRDGMLTGPNLEATAELASHNPVPVIASGGIGRIEHIKQLLAMPLAGAIVGRALYEGKADLAEAPRLAHAG